LLIRSGKTILSAWDFNRAPHPDGSTPGLIEGETIDVGRIIAPMRVQPSAERNGFRRKCEAANRVDLGSFSGLIGLHQH